MVLEKIVAGAGVVLASGVCAYAGTYIGEAVGYIGGNIIDFLPYARDVAPWAAERSGLILDPKQLVDLNENFYQTIGATSGFWFGLFKPFEIAVKATLK